MPIFSKVRGIKKHLSGGHFQDKLKCALNSKTNAEVQMGSFFSTERFGFMKLPVILPPCCFLHPVVLETLSPQAS